MTRQQRVALDDDDFEAARRRVTEPNHQPPPATPGAGRIAQPMLNVVVQAHNAAVARKHARGWMA